MKKLFFAILFVELILVAVSVFPHSVFAQTTAQIPNPLARLGINSLGDLVTRLLQWLMGLLGLVAIVGVVINGFRLVVGGSEESITRGKRGILWSVGGLVTAMLAFTIVSGTANFLGFDAGAIANQDVIVNPLPSFNTQSGDFTSVLYQLIKNFMSLLGAISVIMVIYYGIRYATSGGNEDTIASARKGLFWSLAGLAVILLAFGIVAMVRELLLR